MHIASILLVASRQDASAHWYPIVDSLVRHSSNRLWIIFDGRRFLPIHLMDAKVPDA